MTVRARITPTLAALLLVLAGCASEPPAPVPPATPSAATGAAPDAAPARTQDAIAERAKQLVASAQAVEPQVTPALVAVAAELGGTMIKLEHRLKTLESTERKLRKIVHEQRAPTPLERIELDDLLRYTIQYDDRPPGHYMQSTLETVRRVEALGHQLQKIKNYWPAGDNYSGIHAIYRAPSGLTWELQFHTAASNEMQAKTRDWYEELRREETPTPRKRELFELMTRAWNDVPIPAGALDPARNHPRADIAKRAAP